MNVENENELKRACEQGCKEIVVTNPELANQVYNAYAMNNHTAVRNKNLGSLGLLAGLIGVGLALPTGGASLGLTSLASSVAATSLELGTAETLFLATTTTALIMGMTSGGYDVEMDYQKNRLILRKRR
jgi:hypothetical protein